MVWKGGKTFTFENFFCCVSYILIDSNSKNKLDLKTRKCYFIGYGSDMYDYRFWDDQNKLSEAIMSLLMRTYSIRTNFLQNLHVQVNCQKFLSKQHLKKFQKVM